VQDRDGRNAEEDRLRRPTVDAAPPPRPPPPPVMETTGTSCMIVFRTGRGVAAVIGIPRRLTGTTLNAARTST
jgi:hypothetical protein